MTRAPPRSGRMTPCRARSTPATARPSSWASSSRSRSPAPSKASASTRARPTPERTSVGSGRRTGRCWARRASRVNPPAAGSTRPSPSPVAVQPGTHLRRLLPRAERPLLHQQLVLLVAAGLGRPPGSVRWRSRRQRRLPVRQRWRHAVQHLQRRQLLGRPPLPPQLGMRPTEADGGRLIGDGGGPAVHGL